MSNIIKMTVKQIINIFAIPVIFFINSFRINDAFLSLSYKNAGEMNEAYKNVGKQYILHVV